MAVDTTAPAGEAAAAMMIVFSQLEPRLISQRTKDALAVKKAAGVRLGRPSTLPLNLAAEILAAHRAGSSMAAIARDLTARGTPTVRGGSKWYPSTVEAVLDGQGAARLAALQFMPAGRLLERLLRDRLLFQLGRSDGAPRPLPHREAPTLGNCD